MGHLKKFLETVLAHEQTAGPFDKLRAGSSTAPLAMKLRGPFDWLRVRMTISDIQFRIFNQLLKLKLYVRDNLV